MTALVLDVWHDLRRTRLAPVAIGLVILLAAFPIVMRVTGSSEAAPPAPPPVPPASPGAPAGTAKEALPELERLTAASKREERKKFNLEAAEERNPFQPLDTLDAGGDEAPPPAGDSPGAGASSSAPPTPSPTSSSPVPEPAVEPAPPLTPITDVTKEQDEPEPSDPKDAPRSERTGYTYAVDVDFGPDGSPRELRGVQRLDLVPSKSEPLLVYLGVTPSRRTAVFLVESRLSHTGEGICRPSPEECSFLELRVHPDYDEHFFRDAEGTEYAMKLLAIERVPLERPRPRASAGGFPGLVDED